MLTSQTYNLYEAYVLDKINHQPIKKENERRNNNV